MKLKTQLLSGAGNTFHVAYKQSEFFLNNENAHSQMQKISREICHQHKADGFIFLEPQDKIQSSTDYKWYFFNNDGSDAEMCGNATRCVGFFIKNYIDSLTSSWTLRTVAGPIKISDVGQNQFKVVMSPIIKNTSTQGFFCDTGVPHLVLLHSGENLFLELTEELKLKSKELRFHPDFQPRGTNVTYAQFETDKNKMKAVSYERGVEDFTQACGTGAMAAALFNLSQRQANETLVEMPGGVLKMNLENLDKPTMTGPAILLGSYEHEIKI